MPSHQRRLPQNYICQFAHAPYERIVSLLNSAGDSWSKDEKLKEALKHIIKVCRTRQVYQKPFLSPAVGFPTATCFHDTVVMDLKFYKGKILLHLIDHATHLSACTRVPSMAYLSTTVWFSLTCLTKFWKTPTVISMLPWPGA